MPVAVQRTTKSKQGARAHALALALQKFISTNNVGDIKRCGYYPRRQVISGLSNLIGALNTIPYGGSVHIPINSLHNQAISLVVLLLLVIV